MLTKENIDTEIADIVNYSARGLQSLCTVGVQVPHGTSKQLYRLITQMSSEVAGLKLPQNINTGDTSKKNVNAISKVLAQIQEAHTRHKYLLDSIIDHVLGLENNSLVQSYRLAGGEPVSPYSYQDFTWYWYIDIVAPNKDPNVLRIIFGDAPKYPNH